MKNIIGVLVAVLLLSVTPYTTQANTGEELSVEKRTQMLAQIQTLLELIQKLQAQLDAMKASTPKQPGTVTLIVPYGPPTAKGELHVEQTAPSTLRLYGELHPPTDCLTDTTNKVFEFRLNFTAEEYKTYKISDCKDMTFDETHIYTPSLIPAFPELTYRRVEIHNNTWMNYLQVRYKVDLSNPLNMSIQNLPVASMQKG